MADLKNTQSTDISTNIQTFSQFDRVIPVWLIMFASTVAVYPLFSFWANFRFHLSPKSTAFKLWDKTWMGGFIIYYILFLSVPLYLKGIQMPFGSSVVVIFEHIRLLMKTHAFVRNNAPHIFNYHTHSDKPIPVPSFSTYLYFLFAPTLVTETHIQGIVTLVRETGQIIQEDSNVVDTFTAIFCSGLTLYFDWLCVHSPFSLLTKHMADLKNTQSTDISTNIQTKTNKNGKLREKEFKPRNSLLTDLLEIEHFRSIRHLFIAIFIFLLMNNMLQCYYGSGSINSAFLTIKLSFSQFDRVILLWLLMFASTVAVYPLFSFWANFRFHLSPKSTAFKLWDKTWMGGFIIYYILFLSVPPYLKGIQMHLSSATVVLCEQIRLLMKTHAFVRSNAPRILNHHTHSDRPMPIPTFSKYLYFLFAPTLVYRDSYPRTKEICWTFVLTYFMDCFFCVVFMSIVTSHGVLPLFRNYPSELTTWRSIVITIFNLVPVAMLAIFIFFYFMFHCWLNAWAEIMTFADRQFYRDWWNTTSFSAYYRKWSGTIHDFLYAYIYRDFYETIAPRNKLVSTLSVFLISAIVHEYIVSFMLGSFYPVMMAQFLLLGVPLIFIKVDDKQYCGNVFMWFGFILGIATQITLFSIEYYARINCPRENTDWTDFFIPRSWSC